MGNRYKINTSNTQEPRLFIVSVPIGNPEDISTRAKTILGEEVDFIACEDTRITDRLLQYHGLKASMRAYHDFSSPALRKKIINRLLEGQKVALVSDAGTPLISDPGYKLIQDVIKNDIPFTSIPGPSALITALTLSGLPTDRFFFEGFLTTKQQHREKRLTFLSSLDVTTIIYESAKKLMNTLEDIKTYFGNRDIVVARELTKTYEEIRRGSVQNVIEYYQDHDNTLKGEITLLIAAKQGQDSHNNDSVSSEHSEIWLKKALNYMSVKDASAFIAEISGKKKNELYKKALNIKENKQ